MRLLKDVNTGGITAKKNTLLVPVAVTSKSYVAELPDGRMVQVPIGLLQAATQPLKKSRAVAEIALYNVPQHTTPVTKMIPAGSPLSVLGYYNEFAFVQNGETKGWVLEASLKG